MDCQWVVGQDPLPANEIEMIFVTGVEPRGRREVISGVLLDSFLPAGYTGGIFRAFLSSDRVRVIICEKAEHEGGHGHTRDGLFVLKFTSKLHGECIYTEAPLPWMTILTGLIESRIEFVTTADLHDCAFPAFLALEAVSPPVSMRVVIKLEAMRFADFPDMRAFAMTDPYIMEGPSINEGVKPGTILPVQCEIQGTSFPGALKLLGQVGPTEFEAMLYHERDKGPVAVGCCLTRTVIKKMKKRGKPGEQVEFSARIATVACFL